MPGLPLRIAAAQSASIPGNVSANVMNHCRFIDKAASLGVDVLVFPELALMGYELPLLRDCAVRPDDVVLSPIRERSKANSITVIVGAPIMSETDQVQIGAISFFPDGQTSVYCKQYLHPGEDRYVIAGDLRCCTHGIGDDAFAVAICADTTHEQHAIDASGSGASLYLAGVFWTEAGYTGDASDLQRYATRYNMMSLIANHGEPSGGYNAAGKSACWAPGGAHLVVAPGTGDYLVVASKDSAGWSGEFFPVATSPVDP